jgi:hypothetical protein
MYIYTIALRVSICCGLASLAFFVPITMFIISFFYVYTTVIKIFITYSIEKQKVVSSFKYLFCDDDDEILVIVIKDE